MDEIKLYIRISLDTSINYLIQAFEVLVEYWKDSLLLSNIKAPLLTWVFAKHSGDKQSISKLINSGIERRKIFP